MSGFGSIHTASAMDGYVRNKVKTELDRMSPPPKTAEVVEIDEGKSICKVTYTGETTVVKVPFNSVTPSYVGQLVRIDGPMGDRRITEVLGPSKTERRIEELEYERFIPPLWLETSYEFCESYPLILTDMVSEMPLLESGKVYLTPVKSLSEGSVGRVELRLKTPGSSDPSKLVGVKISAYRVTETFDLQHIETVETGAATTKVSVNFVNQFDVAKGEIIAIGVSVVLGASGTNSNGPRVFSLTSPEVIATRGNYFAMGTANATLQSGDIGTASITKNYTTTMWVAAMPYTE